MFKRIVGHNLFSWESLDYAISDGVSQISGFNFDDGCAEGAGKSSIPNILCWVLYGKLPKSANVDEVIRQGCSGCSGQVHLDDGSTVFRSRKPNDLYITTSDGKTLKGKDAKETQLLINRHVGMDFDAFCQTIYFAQNYPNKFINASETQKVAILSEIQDLTIFDKARKKVTDDLKKLEQQETTCVAEVVRNEAGVERVASNIELLRDFCKKFEDEKKTRTTKIHNEISRLKARLTGLEEYLKDAADITSDVELLQEGAAALSASKFEITAKIKDIDRVLIDKANTKKAWDLCDARIAKVTVKLAGYVSNQNCPVCNEPVKAHNLDKVFKERKTLQNELAELRAERLELDAKSRSLMDLPTADGLKVELAKIEKEEAECRKALGVAISKQSTVKASERELTDVKRQLTEQEAELERALKSQPDGEIKRLKILEKELVEFDEKLEIARANHAEITKDISKLEILKTGFKEIKQYVFQSLLSELSTKATALAQDLFEVPVAISFTNEDEEGGVSKIQTQVILDGAERSLGLLSGGQFKRVELAVDLALSTIIANRSNKPISLRILDEPMKDLSGESKAKVVELLRSLKGSTIIIEHDPIIKSIVNRDFRIEFRGGVSHAV